MLNDHHATLTDTKVHRIDTRGWPIIGDRDAPITVVLYYSITCPACKAGFMELYPAVTTGPLKGKARIVAKPLGNIYGNRALVAAHDMGRFTDFKLALSEITGRIDENIILDVADRLYFDRERFRAMIDSQSVTERTEQSTKDGSDLGVNRIPTYFIEGRRYNSTISPQWVIDAIDFAHETKTR
jgi:protein-disulfide isomerase